MLRVWGLLYGTNLISLILSDYCFRIDGGGEGEGDDDNDDTETSLLPPDESRPLENATLRTPQSYLSRCKLHGILMWHFIEGWARGNWVVVAIQFLSVELILTYLRNLQYQSEIPPPNI